MTTLSLDQSPAASVAVPAQRGAPAMPCRFPFLTFQQALDRAQERPVFLVPGLVSSTLTLFIGEPEAGKSSLAGASSCSPPRWTVPRSWPVACASRGWTTPRG